ncbi:MAG: CBS domain-containing protein [Deltaproteobacteria bacterium]|nr:CBS domain-containing protein [Deltaproteobacteria bacterium]
MKRGPWIIQDTDSLGHAQQMLTQHRIRHLPVLCEGELVGMLSERDLLAARVHSDPDDHWWQLPVRLAMKPAETVDANDLVRSIASRMGTAKLGALAVLERGKLVGVVSVIDILLAHTVSQRIATPPRTAADAMTAHPPTLRPEQPLLAAVRLMCAQHVHELPVVDDDGHVIGMITEADVRRRIGDPETYLSARSPTVYDVQDVMDMAVTPVRSDSTVAELAHYFADARIEALPVVDDRGALVGIVSYLDALNALAS